MNELLGEAMKESLVAPTQANVQMANEDTLPGTDVFFFPDESHPVPEIVPVLVQQPSLDRHVVRRSSDTDDEFCIIGDEAGLGILVCLWYLFNLSLTKKLFLVHSISKP